FGRVALRQIVAPCMIRLVIGQSPRRKEDERLITGRGRFIDDVVLPGLLHLVLVRSTHARARIVAIDTAAARALPGVSAFAAGDVDRAFAEAAVVVEDHPAHGRVSSMAIETRGLCAQFDGATQSMTVWAPHQGPYNLRAAVAARLGLPVESVRVIVPDTGGGFG